MGCPVPRPGLESLREVIYTALQRPHQRVYRRWDVPKGNLLQLYLEACERHGVVVISGVAAQARGHMAAWDPISPYGSAGGP